MAWDLLKDNGSIFVQISDENAHIVRSVLDEIFDRKNFISQIAFVKTTSSSSGGLSSVFDYVIWYAKSENFKPRNLFQIKVAGEEGASQYTFGESSDGRRKTLKDWKSIGSERVRVFAHDNITSQRPAQGEDVRSFTYEGKSFNSGNSTFKTDETGLRRLSKSRRMIFIGNTLRYGICSTPNLAAF